MISTRLFISISKASTRILLYSGIICFTACFAVAEEVNLIFSPVYKITIPKHRDQASLTDLTEAEIIQHGYKKIGDLEFKGGTKTCYYGKCEQIPISKDPSLYLMDRAASLGGDLVRITEPDTPYSGTVKRNGKCLRTESKNTPHTENYNYQVCDYSGCSQKWELRTYYVTETICMEHEREEGTVTGFSRRGSVWRFEPNGYTVKENVEGAFEPDMVNIPTGKFIMGHPTMDWIATPVHLAEVKEFYMTSTEITFDQWDKCGEAGGCFYRPDDNGWGRGARPVINVSYDDIIREYIPWLKKITGKNYRMPTETEWEYAARAGSRTVYSWGNNIGPGDANYGKSAGWENKTTPVGSFHANAFGLFDMSGNVSEWMGNCFTIDYNSKYKDRSSMANPLDCSKRMVRGGSFSASSTSLDSLASSYRMNDIKNDRSVDKGFRLVLIK